MYATFAIAIVLATLALTAALYSIERLVVSSRLEQRAVNVLVQIDVLSASLSRLEIAHRYELAARVVADPEEFGRAIGIARGELDELAALVTDPDQRIRVNHMRRALERKIERLKAEIAAGRSIDGSVDRLPGLVGRFADSERQLLVKRGEATAAEAAQTRLLVFWGGLAAILTLACSAVLLVRYQRAREVANAEREAVEERLRLALEGSDLAAWDYDVEENRVYLSEAWSVILGGPPHPTEINADELMGMVPPSDIARVRAAMAATLSASDAAYDLEHRIRRPDGRLIWIRSRGKVTRRGADGRARRLVGTNSNITERREAEERLRASERQLRLIADAVPEVIGYVDADQRYRFVNKALCDRHGLPADKVLGRTLREMRTPEQYAAIATHVQAALAGEAVHFALRSFGAGGEMRDYDVRYLPHLSEQEQVQGFFAVLLDVTRYKELERLKDDFVATVSHELRSPLTSIRASLGLLDSGMAGPLAPDAAQIVALANRNCERLVRLINEILDLEKARAGQSVGEPRRFDLAARLREAAQDSAVLAQQQGVAMRITGEDRPQQVMADPDKIDQVIANLVSNAIKFSSPGQEIELQTLDLEGRVRVEVRDRGPGVPAEFASRLFETFAQADGGSTRQRGGTGLGLAISKALVEGYGGRIGYLPREGGGSIFWFELAAT